MAEFFDRFVGATANLFAHTADTTEGWSGEGVITGNGCAVFQIGTYNYGYSGWVPPSADYEASIAIGSGVPRWVASIENIPGRVWLLVRVSGGMNNLTAYGLSLLPSSNVVEVFKFVNQVARLDGTSPITNFPQTTWNTRDVFSLRVEGSSPVTLKYFYNGTQIGTYTDSSSPITGAGTIGLGNIWYAVPTAPAQEIFDTLWAGPVGGPTAGVSPSSASVAFSGTQALSATGVLTNESPTWTSLHGTFTGSPGTPVTYTAPSSGASSDTATWTSPDLPTHKASSAITITGGGALALSGPSSGTTGAASTNFTVTATSLSGSDTVTPHSDSGGSFTPTSQSFASGSSSHTFTYTPSADGVHSISITDSLGASISGSPIAYTSTSPTPTGTVLSIGQGFTTGLSTVGYAVYNAAGTLISAWTTTGVTERSAGSGDYSAMVSIPIDGNDYEIRWSKTNATTLPFSHDVRRLEIPEIPDADYYVA